MSATASQITSLGIVYSTVYSGADQRKHQSSMSLAFVWGDFPVTVEFPAQMASNADIFSFDDVIMNWVSCTFHPYNSMNYQSTQTVYLANYDPCIQIILFDYTCHVQRNYHTFNTICIHVCGKLIIFSLKFLSCLKNDDVIDNTNWYGDTAIHIYFVHFLITMTS